MKKRNQECVFGYIWRSDGGTRKSQSTRSFALGGPNWLSHNCVALEPRDFPALARRLGVAEMAENVDYLTADLRDFHVRDLPRLGTLILWLAAFSLLSLLSRLGLISFLVCVIAPPN